MSLIPGGIYSVSGLADLYFVYISDFNKSQFNFLEVQTEEHTFKKVSDGIKVILEYYNPEELKGFISKIDKKSFLDDYNGYLGKVESWVLAELQNAVYLMRYN